MSSTAEDGRPPPRAPARVVVLGGGVAGLEALLALHALGGDRLRLELASASTTARVLPDAIGWARADPVTIDLAALCDELGARLRLSEPSAVDPVQRIASFEQGGTVRYDELLVASAARRVAPYAGVRTLAPETVAEQLAGLAAGRLSIVVPPGLAWTLPAYQLALDAAARPGVQVEVITPEHRPLELFGAEASALVEEQLAAAGVRVLPPATVPRGSDLYALLENVIVLPLLRGPVLPGLPADACGRLPVDGRGRVLGVAAVHAAGEITDRPFSHGTLPAQDAEVAAADIAAHASAPGALEAPPRELHGALVGPGGDTIHFGRVLDGSDPGRASRQPFPASAPAGGQRLARWLAHRAELPGAGPLAA